MTHYCECSDPGCPCCEGSCVGEVTMTLFRSDMDDESGVEFCVGCGEDALESGVFYSELEDEDEDDFM